MPSALFKLDMFEGPLDLLLHLINKHKLDIHDIEISVLLDQYLEYMAALDHEDLEDAADFLEMAARLVYIKAVSLLPVENEGEALKKELEGSLIEYSLCKMAAARLRESYIGGEVFVREPVKLPVNKTFTGEKDPMSLLEAYLGIGEKARKMRPLRAEIFRPIVSHKIVSVTSKIIHVLKMLFTEGVCELERLYDGSETKSERVAVFLAVLELTKSGRIFLDDDNSKVFMNSAARRKRISSDFDRAEAAQETAEAVTEPQVTPEPDLPENGGAIWEDKGEEKDFEDAEEEPFQERTAEKRTGYRAESIRTVGIRLARPAVMEEVPADGNTPDPGTDEVAEEDEPFIPDSVKPGSRPNFFAVGRYRWGWSPTLRYWRYGLRRY